MTEIAWDVGAGVLAVAVIYMLVRPSSAGPQMVTAFTGAMADIVSFAVGGI